MIYELNVIDHTKKALYWIILHQVQLILEAALLPPVRIDDYHLGITHGNAGIGLHDPHRIGKHVIGPEVISRGPLQILRVAQLENPIEVSGHANVHGVAVIAHPRILLHVALTDGCRTIGGGIVTDHHDEVRIGLGQQRFDRLGHMPLGVVDRNANGDQRRGN